MTGQTITHYRITANLGAGGMGEVYRASDTKRNRVEERALVMELHPSFYCYRLMVSAPEEIESAGVKR